MRFVVVGAGAVGGVVGARLAQHGHDVVLVARGPHLEAIRADGLRLDSPDGSVTIVIDAVADPAAAGIEAGDVVLLAVKSQDTPAALDALAAAAPATVPVVCLQNGVANEREALRRFRDVYGCCVMSPTNHLRPGIVEASSTPITGTARPRSVPGRRRRRRPVGRRGLRRVDVRLGSPARHHGLEVPEAADEPRQRVEALAGRQAAAGDVTRRAVAEGRACFAAAGITSVPDDEERARRGDAIRIGRIDGQPRGGGSTWQSLARGAPVETDHLNGEVVLLGRLHGVPTPVNAALQQLVRDQAGRGAGPASMSEDELDLAISARASD